MPDVRYSHFWIFISAFGLSSFAGLAALLRSGKHITWKSVATATFNSGLLGLAVALCWIGRFKPSLEELPFVIGVCVLAGLGGTTLLDFLQELFKSGGVTIHITRNDEPKK